MLKNSISKVDYHNRASERLFLATNLRFVALILRWGKKSRSYNVFLNALSLCKHLSDTSSQKGVNSTTKVFENKNNKIQKVPIKRLLHKHDTTIPTPAAGAVSEKVYTQKKRSTSPAQSHYFDKNKGCKRDRLQAKFFFFSHNLVNTSTSFSDKTNVKGRFASTFSESKSVAQRSLYSRRAHLRTVVVPAAGAENFTKKTVPTYDLTTKKIDFGSLVRASEEDSSRLPLPFLLKKKNITTKNDFDFGSFERLAIGIKSVLNVIPSVETRKVRIGGAAYAVPYVPHNARQEGLGIRWLIACAFAKKQRSNTSWEFCLASVLADTLKNEGQSVKKRDQSHQTAAANRAYTRYRWW